MRNSIIYQRCVKESIDIESWFILSQIYLIQNATNNQYAVQAYPSLLKHLQSFSTPAIQSFVDMPFTSKIQGFAIAEFLLYQLGCLVSSMKISLKKMYSMPCLRSHTCVMHSRCSLPLLTLLMHSFYQHSFSMMLFVFMHPTHLQKFLVPSRHSSLDCSSGTSVRVVHDYGSPDRFQPSKLHPSKSDGTKWNIERTCQPSNHKSPCEVATYN